MTVLETISKLEQTDEASARVLLRLALYEAVCDEADRVRPQLEAEVAKALDEKIGQGLLHLARQPISKDTIDTADALIDLSMVSKRDNWDEREHPRDPDSGEFVPKMGGLRRGILNALGFATSPKADPAMESAAHGAFGSWAGPKADNYSRLRSLGTGLVATNDPNARPAGTVMRLIGDIGPEAQKHLEPGIRRTAYRYRGTERRPDQNAQAMAADLVANLQGPGQDRKRLDMTSNLGVAQLLGQIPDKDTAAISLAAGKMPPSVGVMFDGRGRLVSEAMGYNGDHYLPFDLKNLKRLHGGSYVRTRTTGGPTDEDIYTGLMTGTRHITVVSNSGVFTIEFDKDLRGGRRYSDKARQMVDRYARLVGAIGSGELYQNQLPQADIADLRKEALRAAHGNAEAAKKIFQRKLAEKQEAAAFLGQSDDELMENAVKLVDAKQKGLTNQNRGRAIRDTFYELRDDEAKTAARKYRLDGEGYKAAMKALQTEFPYFIRETNFTPLKQYMSMHNLEDPKSGAPRGGSDMGYTPRGGVDPDKAGIKDRTDEEGKRRKILGAPRKPAGHATEESGSVAQGSGGGGGGGTATPVGGGPTRLGGGGGGAAVGLDAALAEAAKDRLGEVNTALQRSAKARTALAAQFAEPVGDESLETTRDTLTGQEYVKRLVDLHGGGDDPQAWAKISRLMTEGDPRYLDKMIAALDEIPSGFAHEPTAVARFPQKNFDEAKETLRKLRKLRKPFRDGAFDPELEPEVGETDPQAHPEITALGTDVEKIKAYNDAAEDGSAVDIAAGWAQANKDDEAIRAEVAQKAALLKKLRKLAVDPEAKVYGIDKDSPEIQAQVEEIRDMGDEAAPVRELADMHKAWSLLRLHQVVGAMQGTGAAVPFDRPETPPEGTPGVVAMRDSTPSRIVWHHPVSKASMPSRPLRSVPLSRR